jgi:hypothetical protein
MASKQCAGCPNKIRDGNYVRCRTCKLFYDLLCANLSPKQFSSMSKDRNEWICPICLSKCPKIDNQNTPIRSQLSSEKLSIDESSSDQCNVTKRSKPQRHVAVASEGKISASTDEALTADGIGLYERDSI